MEGHRIGLFGPLVTQWTDESLSKLSSTIATNVSVAFLKEAIEDLPSLWPLLERDFGSRHGFSGLDELKALRDFAQGTRSLVSHSLGNTHLATLSIASQIIDLIGSAEEDISLPAFDSTQGFCYGFLSAAALSSAKDWAEFEANIGNAVRLAACIGLAIDEREAALEAGDRASTVSVRWKTHADRARLETCLDVISEAYVSCITGDNTLTITLPVKHRESFLDQLRAANFTVSTVSIPGSYHHQSNGKIVEKLTRICAENSQLLGLPTAEGLRLPLRSTADACLITSGALHEIALDLILCRKAHWYQTVKSSPGHVSWDQVSITTFGKQNGVVPVSLRRNAAAVAAQKVHCTEDNREEIAVVGMACRFPRAESLAAFWELLSKGDTAFGTMPPTRFSPEDISRGPKVPNFWGNFLDRVDAFDHRFFSLSGREAKSMDPQQRMALEVAYDALESAGYFSGRNEQQEKDVGCYLGVGAVEYEQNVASESAGSFAAVGILRAFISGRISHFFSWNGPSMTLDTACSSSVVAIHTACKAILSGECAMALAGGVNVITSPLLHQNLAAASFLNPNGSSKAFDAAAAGYCRGEGAGMLVLKKISRALADGDEILGVIASSAVGQGSNNGSITVPDPISQSALYRRVLNGARIQPQDVGYVEAHGTGTQAGDPVEYESVRLALTGSRKEPVYLGTVKDNIGHTEAASGVAGVIKVLLMMQQDTIPKQANFVSLNPKIRASADIIIPKCSFRWTEQLQQVALVNNYGASGNIAALLLRSYKKKTDGTSCPTTPISTTSAEYPVFLSGKTAAHLTAYATALKEWLPSCRSSFSSVAYSISRTRNSSFQYRMAFTASDAQRAISMLSAPSQVIEQKEKLPVVLCFGGQTSNIVKVSKSLYESCALFLKHLDACNATCRALGLSSIFPHIFLGNPIEDVVLLHCCLLSSQIASAKCWIECSVQVECLVGHSFGQLTALCIASSLSVEDTFRLVAGRAQLIRNSWGPEKGGMLSVECDKASIEAVMSAVGEDRSRGIRLELACYNGLRSFVLAGTTVSIKRAEEECQKRSIKCTKLRNSHAYHSYLTSNILQGLGRVAESITIRPPVLHVETCSPSGNWLSFTKDELVRHTREPVYFSAAVERISTRLGRAVWLEAGSESPVIQMARRVVGSDTKRDVFVSTNLGNHNAMSNVAKAACSLWNAGHLATFWGFHRDSTHNRIFEVVNIPPCQFEKTSHWIQLKMKPEIPKYATDKKSLINLQSRITSREFLFSVDKTNAAFVQAVRGHAVTGQSLCPASMYIELAALAILSATEPTEQQSSAGLPHVEGLVMSSPLSLGLTDSLFVRLVQGAAGNWKFSIFSRPNIASSVATIELRDTEHARGKMTRVLANSPAEDRRLKLLERFGRQGIKRFASWKEGTGISGAMVYQIFSDVVTYADYYRGVQSISGFDQEAVGSVIVPAQLASAGSELNGDCVCDPIIVDNFLQVAGIHVNCLSERNRDQVFVCTAVEEIIFTPDFVSNRSDKRKWSVYSRFEADESNVEVANDIFVCDKQSGNLVVAILGTTFRSVPFKSLARNLSRLNKSPAIDQKSQITNKIHSPFSAQHSDKDLVDDSGYQTSTTPALRQNNETSSVTSVEDDPQVSPKRTETDDTVTSVSDLFSVILEVPVNEIKPSSTLEELGVDSLLVSEIISEIKGKFMMNVSQNDLLECENVLDVSKLLYPGTAQEHDSNRQFEATPRSNKNEKAKASAPNTKPVTMSEGVTCQSTNLNVAVQSAKCFVATAPSYEQYAQHTKFAGFYSEAFQLQSELVVRYVADAFASLGCNLECIQAGDPVPLISFHERHTKLIPQLYDLLVDNGLIERATGETFRRTQVPFPVSSASMLHQRMLDQYPQHTSETLLLYATGPKLAECLSGQADPIALIFQNAAARALLEDVYTNAPMFKTGTLVLGQYLKSILQEFSTSRKLKILEIGAGTGGTTKHIVDLLSRLGYDFSYTFTDLSSSLVATAKRKFAKWSSFIRYEILNIENEPSSESCGQYDIILSTNCIHATKNLVTSTTNIRRMLRPDGILCLVELTRNLYWFDLVFGLLEGWWLFDDCRNHALAHEELWRKDLRTAGFEWVEWSSSPLPESDILRVITASPYKVKPGARKDDKVTPKQTLVFKKVDDLELSADIYLPSPATAAGRTLPIALMVHGGGHVLHSRDDIRPEQTDMLLRNGFLPVSIDYRLCPKSTLVDGAMTDVVDALGWVRSVLPGIARNRWNMAVDPEKVVAVGWSAGGHLAMTLGWTAVDRGIQPPSAIMALYCATDFEDPFWTRTNVPMGVDAEDSSCELDEEIWSSGISDRPITSYNIAKSKRSLDGWLAPSDARSRLLLYMNTHGRTLDVLLRGLNKQTRSPREAEAINESKVQAASPLAQVRQGKYRVPTFLIHPRNDDLIPWEQSERTWKVMREYKLDAELRIIDDGARHLFDMHPRGKGFEAGMRSVIEGYAFLARHVGAQWT